jgi:hypothetical protein
MATLKQVYDYIHGGNTVIVQCDTASQFETLRVALHKMHKIVRTVDGDSRMLQARQDFPKMQAVIRLKSQETLLPFDIKLVP